MDKKQAESLVNALGDDDRNDLLMYLAEGFGYKVIDSDGDDITYFLASDYTIFTKKD